MKNRMNWLIAIAIITILSVVACGPQLKPERPCQQCVDFELPLTIGSKYGSSNGNHSGDVIFTTNGIKVSVLDFHQPSGGTNFGNATIASPPFPFGINQTINTNNINLGFDFTSVGFVPMEVQLEFLDLGGIQNLSVNGSPVHIGTLSTAPSVIAGVNVTVFVVPVSGNQQKGVVILRGPAIQKIMVGGQEFWLDQVCVKK